MGPLSINSADNLFWLGRYAERSFLILELFTGSSASLHIQNRNYYKTYCLQFGIEDTYLSFQEFISRFLLNEKNIQSLASGLSKAYDNAFVLRDILKDDGLSFLRMAKNELEDIETFDPIGLKRVSDFIMAFWGSIGEYVPEPAATLLMCGKTIEKLDFYIRTEMDTNLLLDEFEKLKTITVRIGFKINFDENILLQKHDLRLEKINQFLNENLHSGVSAP